jgi:ferredoxin--NADP+ reductase
MATAEVSAPTPEDLRLKHYNAIVCFARRSDDETLVFRIRPDALFPPVRPGQAASLGLGRWEPRCDGVPVEFDPAARTPLIRRSYSVASSMIDERGEIVPVGADGELEFLVTLVTSETDDPSRLTPRLFALGPGDRLFLAPKPFGRYGFEGVGTEDDVLLLATGTGEAPHTAMVAALLAAGHRGRIAAMTSARQRSNLAYLDAHRAVERRFANYCYVPVTTREPENLDPVHPGYVGRRHLQELFVSGDLARQIGWNPDPLRTFVFLCGRPEFLGVGSTTRDEPGMVPLLTAAGFPPDRIRFERYW